jgi:HprK-related kinase A
LKVSQLSASSFVRELRRPGISLSFGPFDAHVQTSIEFLARAIHLLYSDFTIVDDPQFADFYIRMQQSTGLRRWVRPYVSFSLDDETPFSPLPFEEAVAMFEWCLNWCIETRAHQYLTIHAAVVERSGAALILPAPPGSGKSTLTAALINRGWRLLSDELTLIDPILGSAVPIARPVGLKNESIEVIQNFLPTSVIGPLAFDKMKGTIAHLKPPRDSVERAYERALPQWVIFPKFHNGSPAALSAYPKANALLRLADSAFNYSQHGVRGFETLSTLIERCDCYEFSYSRLDEAIAVFDSLSQKLEQRGLIDVSK